MKKSETNALAYPVDIHSKWLGAYLLSELDVVERKKVASGYYLLSELDVVERKKVASG